LKRNLLILGLILYFALCAGVLVVIGQLRERKVVGPVQPIAFSHPIHVGRLGLECLFCHQTADRSRVAGVPPLKTCMGCHETAATDRPEVQKLIGHWKRAEPVAWERVHKLPWHVGFNHKRHIKAGVECSRCHGEVKAQAQVRQVRSLKMGWCVGCHRARGADTDCWVCHK
jgi:hypothetical protein